MSTDRSDQLHRPITVRIPDAVRLTGISRSRLYEFMKDGSIEYVKIGSSTLVLVESLIQFVDDHRTDRAKRRLTKHGDAPEASFVQAAARAIGK